MTVHIYSDFVADNDAWDGQTPTHEVGPPEHGPKRHLNAAKALIPNPVEDEYIIHVAGDTANPGNYVYIDGTDVVLDFSDLDMTHPAARITVMPYIAALAPDGFDNTAYNSGTESPDGGPAWNVAGTKPFTMPQVIAGKNNKITLVGARVLQTATNKPAIIVRDMADLAAAYCRIEGGYAGVRVSSANAGIENTYITEAEFGVFVEAGGQAALLGRNILHENSTCGIRGRLRSSVVVCAWPMKPLLKYQTTISTAAPKGNYAAVGLEHDSSLLVLKSIPDETTGGPDIPAAAELQILNATLAKSAAYYGIVLTTRSLLVGANQVRFNDEAINQGKDTVPDGQQIVAKTHSVAEE